MTSPHACQPRSLPSDLARPFQRALTTVGCTPLEQLAQVTEAGLARMHGIGAKAIEPLRNTLAAAGLSFVLEN